MKRFFHSLAAFLLIFNSLASVPVAAKSDGDSTSKMHFQGPFFFDKDSNERLYQDMLLHLDDFIAQTPRMVVQDEVKAFASSVKAAHKSSPYAWIGETFAFVDRLKKEYPPVISTVENPSPSAIVRKNILMLLDFPLHCYEYGEDSDPNVRQVYPVERSFHYLRTQINLVRWLELPPPEPGHISIAKVYSSGFLFRTHDHMMALDLRWDGSEEIACAICEMTDLFLLTHNHNDHYSLNVLERMALMGKPFVVPSNRFSETNIANVLSSYSKDNKYLWEGPLGTEFEQTQIGPAKVQAVMGAQGDEPCLLYMVELDGWRIAAVGDNSHLDLQQCYSKWEAPDFFCTPIFQSFPILMQQISKAPNPEGRTPVYLPHHENEWHHPVSHRVGYRFLFNSNVHGLAIPDFPYYTPFILMDGGEHVEVSREQ